MNGSFWNTCVVTVTMLAGCVANIRAAGTFTGTEASSAALTKGNRILTLGSSGLASLDVSEFRIRTEPGISPGVRSWRKMRSASVAVETRVKTLAPDVVHIDWVVQLRKPFRLVEVAARFRFLPRRPSEWRSARERFHWIPNIKAKPDQIASDHVFRSPAAILTSESDGVVVVPDLDTLRENRPAPHFLDMQFPDGEAPWIEYGIVGSQPEGHTYYVRNGKPFDSSSKPLRFSCYVLLLNGYTKNQIVHRTSQFLWDRFSPVYRNRLAPQTVPFSTYATYGYEMALRDLWVPGSEPGTGGITLTSFFNPDSGQWRGRFSKNDLWFHSWFNNVRTAWGMYYWGKMRTRPEWVERARAMARMILTAPQEKGLFATIYKSAAGTWESSGQGGGPGVYHLPDNAWTALWVLRFHEERERLPGADEFLTNFAEALMRLQHTDGSFPARVRVGTLETDPVLDRSASGALPVWFLGEMLLRGKISAGRRGEVEHAIRAGVAYLREHVIPEQRFDDFELYFSCSKKPLDFFDPVTSLHGQNTLAIQWCAEAFRSAYLLFGSQQDLEAGRFCLDLLSLYQQVWSPPYLSFYSFGGFGVMNTDAEWNDARQAQFAETFARYYETTRDVAYLQRAVAATRAGFALVVMDENKVICPNNFSGTDYHFEVHGASAENYGHSGEDKRAFQSGFHWGTGSALTTAAYFTEKYRDIYIDTQARQAVGFDGLVVNVERWGSHDLRATVKSLRRPDSYVGRVELRRDRRVELILNEERIKVDSAGRFQWSSKQGEH